jgi:hypothetical protein
MTAFVQKITEAYESIPPFETYAPRIYRWLGIQDFSEGVDASKRKDYISMAKSFAIGSLKIGTVLAGIYGAYRYFSTDPVYLNDLYTGAAKEYQARSGQSYVPRSIVDMTQSLYHEYASFRRFPESAKDLVLEHLQSSSPMSSAIIQWMTGEAAKQDDSSFRAFVIKTCKAANESSSSCLASLQGYIGAPTPRDSLDQTMGIVSQCRASQNRFCQKARAIGQKLSLQLESWDDLSTFISQSIRQPTQEGRVFAEKIAPLYLQHLQKLEEAMAACERHQKEACAAQATLIDRIMIADRGPWSYEVEKARENREALQSSLESEGLNLAKLCLLYPDSEPCRSFIDKMASIFAKNGLSKPLSQLLIKTPSLNAETYLPIILDRAAEQGHWKEGVEFTVEYLRRHPLPKLNDAIARFYERLFQDRFAGSLAMELIEKGILNERKDLLTKALQMPGISLRSERFYQLVKSWIEEKQTEYLPQIFIVINKLFDEEDWHSETLIAKLIVSKLLQARDPNAVQMTAQMPHYLPGAYEQYDDSITRGNWKQKLIDAGFSKDLPDQLPPPKVRRGWFD